MLELTAVLLLGLAMVVVVPLLLLRVAFGLLGVAIALPFKILGGLLHVVAGAGKLLFGLAGLVGLALLVLVLPLLAVLVPIALFAGCIFLAVKVLTAVF